MPDSKSADAGRRLYLIDAMALAYRSHFIFISRPLINSKGKNTSATYGFTNALIKLIEDHGMDHMAVVFDAEDGEGTFRDDLYDAYKANRDPMPDDLRDNLPYIKEVVEALDIPVIVRSGVEADDVIGTLARCAEADGAEVVIVSPDKDFQQLISERISIFRPAHRGEEFDPITIETFREKFGVEPLQFIDILALMGDSSDNVPGVPGIGEKTAMSLIQQYGTVENLLEHAADVKGKRAREGLQNHSGDARLSKQLVTIKTDCDVDLDWHTLKRTTPNLPELERLFAELEFRTLLERVRRPDEQLLLRTTAAGSELPPPPSVGIQGDLGIGGSSEMAAYAKDSVKYEIVRNREQLENLASALIEHERIAFDTETTSTDPMWASLVGMSFSWAEGQSCYVPTPLPDGTPTDIVIEILRPAFESETPKIGQNLKYDLLVLANHGVLVRGTLFDTMVAHYLIAPEDPHNLDALAQRFLNYRMVPISDLIGTGRNQLSMRDVPIDDCGPYACEDADIAMRLAGLFEPVLSEHNLDRVANEIEFPLIPVLVDMEKTGIRIEPGYLEEISRHMAGELQRLEGEIYAAAGVEFNIGSPQQLGEILFDHLGLRIVSRTSKGQASTKESVLQELATEHPLPGLILDWRQISKLKSTYVDSLGALAHPETGRVHTNFNQTVAATGRLSSSNPNLQNIPVRTDMGREIRKAFVPREGWVLMAADYVQIELRILAAMSDDKALKEAFETGQDIHAAAAARVFGVPLDEVTRDQRRKAKEINYGIPYGVSPWGLAQRLRSSVQEAGALIDQYQKSYSGVSRFLAEQVERARKSGYVETMMGRRRYVPDIRARNRTVRSFAERVAVNMPIQGTQADMIKIAMIRIHAEIEKRGLMAKMLLQVHDELVFEAPSEEIETLREIVDRGMRDALPLSVPVEVDIDTGENWLDAH
jgi:DNA polymerase I